MPSSAKIHWRIYQVFLNSITIIILLNIILLLSLYYSITILLFLQILAFLKESRRKEKSRRATNFKMHNAFLEKDKGLPLSLCHLQTVRLSSLGPWRLAILTFSFSIFSWMSEQLAISSMLTCLTTLDQLILSLHITQIHTLTNTYKQAMSAWKLIGNKTCLTVHRQ